MKSNQNTAVTHERNQRLTKYCAAGAGAAVLVGAVTTADAAVVFINFNNQVFTDPAQDGVSSYFTSGTAGNFDFNKDGVVDFRLRQRNNSAGSSAGNLAGVSAPTTGTIRVIGTANGTNQYPSRLAANTLIGPAATFGTLTNGATGFLASGSGFSASKWVSDVGPASGFLGISFAAGANTYYGWISLSVAGLDAPIPYVVTLNGIAYDDTPNTAILAGATTTAPEPGSLSLLALGGVGLAAYRRKRNAAKVAAV